MPKLPRKAPFRKVANLLIKFGYHPSKATSGTSHIKFEKEGCRPIPLTKAKNIPEGTLRQILNELDITREKFFEIWDDL